MSKGKKREWFAWAGFVSGRIYKQTPVDSYEIPARQFEIFASKKAAKCRYEDVRRVRITLVKP